MFGGVHLTEEGLQTGFETQLKMREIPNMEIRHLCQEASGTKVNKVLFPKGARRTLCLQFALCVHNLQSSLPNRYKSFQICDRVELQASG